MKKSVIISALILLTSCASTGYNRSYIMTDSKEDLRIESPITHVETAEDDVR
jgi:uncharacterized lipoprotein YmbA